MTITTVVISTGVTRGFSTGVSLGVLLGDSLGVLLAESEKVSNVPSTLREMVLMFLNVEHLEGCIFNPKICSQ